jgi:two-component system response regulator HydG
LFFEKDKKLYLYLNFERLGMKHKILILEDDASFGRMLQSWFNKNNFEASLFARIKDTKAILLEENFSLVITDLRLPDGDGIMFLSWVKEKKPQIPVIIMTSYAEVQSAVLAMKLGAFDYLEKPINPSILKQKVEQALEQIPAKKEHEHFHSKNSNGDKEVVYGHSKAANRLYEHIKIVAPTNMSVLIIGESGTGKEYAARIIHEQSNRKNAPFIAVDCGSLSKELAPSELFGHLKGSFTSAIADKKGVFEQAEGGTVFLDEVGNLSYDVQIQLLRALQELRVKPIGSAVDIKVNVRIIVATNESLETAIAKGKFREDLYHRLNEFSIIVPPLRERANDIVIFAKHFLNQANKELGKNIERITDNAISILKQHHWSGNLRELRNVIRRAVLFATDEINTSHLPDFLSETTTQDQELFSLHPDNEKEQILAALKKTNGNKTNAAKLLRIDRKTLYNKIHQYGIEL